MTNRLTSTSYLRRAAGIVRRPAAHSAWRASQAAQQLAHVRGRPSQHQTPVRARTVGAYVPGLTEKAFDKYGFPAVSLISDWGRIAGPALAAHTAPERLKWPRPVGKYADLEEGCEGRPGATLVLRVDPARAFEVEYGRAQLIERINGYFGYRAVERIKIIQAPLQDDAARADEARTSAEPAAKPPARQPARRGETRIAVADPALEAALERLAASFEAA